MTYLRVDNKLFDLVHGLLEGGSLARLDELLLELLVRLDVVVLNPGAVDNYQPSVTRSGRKEKGGIPTSPSGTVTDQMQGVKLFKRATRPWNTAFGETRDGFSQY